MLATVPSLHRSLLARAKARRRKRPIVHARAARRRTLPATTVCPSAPVLLPQSSPAPLPCRGPRLCLFYPLHTPEWYSPSDYCEDRCPDFRQSPTELVIDATPAFLLIHFDSVRGRSLIPLSAHIGFSQTCVMAQSSALALVRSASSSLCLQQERLHRTKRLRRVAYSIPDVTGLLN